MIIIFGLILLFCVVGILTSQDKAKSESQKKVAISDFKIKIKKEFPGAKLYLRVVSQAFLLIDFANEQIVMGRIPGIWKKIPFPDIIKVEVLKDGAQIFSTNRRSQALGVAVGAVALGGVGLGGVGAVIGGLSGSKTATNTINRISLKITVDSIDRPIYEIIFFKAPDDKNVAFSEGLFSEVNTFVAHLEKAIRIADESKQATIPQSKEPETLAGKIAELWKLKEAGALTKKEFDAQKTRLMGEAK